MLSDILKWGGKRLERPQGPVAPGTSRGAAASSEEPVVGSKAFPKFLSLLTAATSPAPVLVDFGPVIGTNVEFFGERLGCKLFIEDLIGDLEPAHQGRHARHLSRRRSRRGSATPTRASTASCAGTSSTSSTRNRRDALARQVIRMVRPGGVVMGLFCTSAKPEQSSFTKYEIVDEGNFRHKQHGGAGGMKRAIQNRDIIRMFEGLTVSDSFLLKSNIREMLLRRRQTP